MSTNPASKHPYIQRTPISAPGDERTALAALNVERNRGSEAVEVTYYFSVDHEGPSMAGLW